MGAKSEHVTSISDLEAAFKRAKASDVTYVIQLKLMHINGLRVHLSGIVQL